MHLNAGENPTGWVALPHIDVVVESWVELANHLLSLARFLSEDFFNKFGYLLNHLLNHCAWLPLGESIWQDMQQQVSAVSERRSTESSFGHDKRWLEGIFVPEDDFKVKFIYGAGTANRSL